MEMAALSQALLRPERRSSRYCLVSMHYLEGGYDEVLLPVGIVDHGQIY